jgi:hypothetical protein
VTFPTTAGADAFLRLAETVTDRAWLAGGAALARINHRGPREGVLIGDTHAAGIPTLDRITRVEFSR